MLSSVLSNVKRTAVIVFIFTTVLYSQTTKTVGAGGDYATLKDAFDAINAGSVTGAITLNVIASTTEATACTLNAGGAGAANYSSLLIQPSGGAAVVISGSIAGDLIYLNGADNVAINGLNTGGNSLTISNTATGTTTSTLRFANDATNNTVTNCSILGASTGTGTGTIWFSTTTGTTGNDNNTISNSDIGPAGTTPVIAIYSLGTALKENSGVLIDNCNIYDFYSTSLATYGIQLAATGNTNWTIKNNRLYQTASRNYTTGNTHYGIFVGGGTDYYVYKNIIGYTSNTQTGSYTMNGNVATRYVAINLAAGTTGLNYIRGNVVSNHYFSTTSNAFLINGIWCGILAASGTVSIDSNRIGSTSQLSIVTGSTFNALTTGIVSQSTTGDIAIQNNTVSGIRASGNEFNSTIGAGVTGINITSGGALMNLTVRENLIGSASMAHSLSNMTFHTAPVGAFSTIGISVGSGFTGNVTIAKNTVRNISTCLPTSRSSGALTLTGISNASIGSSTGAVRIDSNTVQNINSYPTLTTTNTSSNTGIINSGSVTGQTLNIRNNVIRDNSSGTAPPVLSPGAFVGINISNSPASCNLSGNQIFNITATHPTASVTLGGIHLGGGVANAILQNNTIYDFSIQSTSASSSMSAIYISGGTKQTIQNNIVRFSPSTNHQVYGLANFANSATTVLVYHNSFYLGGTAPANNTARSICYWKNFTLSIDSIYNNIFFNNRINGTGGTAKNYCIYSTSSPTSTLVSNTNNLYAPNTGGVVFGVLTGSTDYATLQSYRLLTGNESAGFSADPLFVNPTATVPDLSLPNPNPQSKAGIRITTVATDYAGNVRPGIPGERPDIGAYEGNFSATPNSMDFQPPLITINSSLPLSFDSTAATRVLTNFAAIEDNSSLHTGSYGPRIYFRRLLTDADDFTAVNSGLNSSGNPSGWRYVPGVAQGGGVYSFTVDYTKLPGETVSVGDTIIWFIAAMDSSTVNGMENLGTNMAGGTASGSPVINAIVSPFTAAFATNKYYIAATITGTYTVGTGGDFTSLTGTSGAFDAIRKSVIGGDVKLSVISDLTETGSVALTNTSPFKIRIVPRGSLTVRKIEGTAVATGAPMIDLNGADRVIVDGADSATGGGRYLRFINNNATPANTGPVFRFINDAGSDSLRNIIIESNATTLANASVLLSTTTGSGGNDSIVVDSCLFTASAGTNPGNYFTAISSTGTGSGNQRNSDNTFIDNNFTGALSGSSGFIYISGTGNGDNWSIINNRIYNNVLFTSNNSGIYINNAGTNNVLISGNSIGGSNPDRSGTFYGNQTSGSINGIYLNAGSTVASSVQGNLIGNLGTLVTGATLVVANGINIAGGKVNVGTVTGNTIGGAANPWDTLVASADAGWISSSGADTVIIENNLIGNANYWRQGNDRNAGINISGGYCIVRNNTIRDLMSNTKASDLSSFSVKGIQIATGTQGNLVEGNTIYNIKNTNRGADTSYNTIGILYIGSGSLTIQKNTIYNLYTSGQGSGNLAPVAAGIGIANTSTCYIYNNRISLTNTGNQTICRGIFSGYTGTVVSYYNTIFIGGNNTGSTSSSACYYRSITSTDTIINNFFYNQRTGGLLNVAIGSLTLTGWNKQLSNNGYVVANLNAVCDSAGTGKTLAAWQNGTGSDANSRVETTGNITASGIFTDYTVGNLKIIPGYAGTSFVNNYGTPLINVTTDFEGDSRNNTTPDLGSDEFSVTVLANSLLRLTAIIEGLYNTGSNTMVADTMKVYLRRTTTPYAVVDSSTVLLSTAGQGVYSFTKTIRDSSFYLQLYNKRALETWSKTGVLFNADTVSYDFTTAANKAYGDNQALRGTKYCLYSGDVNQDGVIDLSDIIVIDNDNANFVTGDAVTDLNGDGVVDLSDLLLADNNNANFIARVTPLSGKRVVNPRPVKVLQQ